MVRKRRVMSVLFAVLIAASFAAPGVQLAGGPTECLVNGDFEAGFEPSPDGRVGQGWVAFHNGGRATHGFYDEKWTPVIYSGRHSQLIEINTSHFADSDPDRYAGIYQTVAVVPGQTYDLSLHGMLRALEDDPDRSSFSYRVQYGVDYDGGTDWQAVSNWVDIPWDTIYPRLSPGSMGSFSTSIAASGRHLTLFIRAWKKWGTVQRELDVNLDAISLKGAIPAGTSRPAVSLTGPASPVAGWETTIPVEASSEAGVTALDLFDGTELVGSVSYDAGQLSASEGFDWTPSAAGLHTLKAVVHDAAGVTRQYQLAVGVGEERDFLVNGDFEGGFYGGPWKKVGNGWSRFDNGGQVTYGYYDDVWTPVVHDGQHSQLIEISTVNWNYSDPDRYSGIYQTVSGLTSGATYKLSMYGMLRALSSDGDRNGSSYRVQWGYDPHGGTDWQAVGNWVDVPWNQVYDRLAPGEMADYTASFEAPSTEITLFFRVWKKWATTGRQLDVNLDSIALTGHK